VIRARLTKSDAIRTALKGGALTLDQIRAKIERSLHQIVNKQKLYTLLSLMQNSGEIDSAGRGKTRVYVLMPGKRKA
jgi:hypothetical protein